MCQSAKTAPSSCTPSPEKNVLARTKRKTAPGDK